MKDGLKVVLITVVGLFVSAFVYPTLHEVVHTLATIFCGGGVKEFHVFPTAYVICDMSNIRIFGEIIIGLSGMLLPFFLSSIIQTKKFWGWYICFIMRGICILSFVISLAAVVLFHFGHEIENEDIIQVLKMEPTYACLELFVSKGVFETSVRDLSNAINLQVSGMYYYFKSKDDAVITCAEEAALRLENNLIAPAIKDVSDPDRMIRRLFSRADEMAPMMRFFVQVCASPKYLKNMKPALDRLAERYKIYAEKFAAQLGCTYGEIKPYMYMSITAMTNYMIFGNSEHVTVQIAIIKNHLKKLLEDYD